MALAQIDMRIVERLVFAAVQTATSGSLSAYAPGEPLPDGATAWVQMEPIQSNGKGCAGGGGSAPDSAELTLRFTVALADSETRTDVFQLDTAITRVMAAIRRQTFEDAASGHAVYVVDAAQSGDTVADESRRIRTASVTATGMAYRTIGATLE